MRSRHLFDLATDVAARQEKAIPRRDEFVGWARDTVSGSAPKGASISGLVLLTVATVR